MNMLDPFEGEDDDSDQENAPPVHLPSTDTYPPHTSTTAAAPASS